MKSSKGLLVGFGAVLVILFSSAAAQNATSTGNTTAKPAVRIEACGKNSGGKQDYRYVVHNGSQARINAVWIGFEWAGDFELEVFPKHNLSTGLIPASLATSPAGWQVKVINQEESDRTALEWSVINTDGNSGIPPGDVRSGFSVTVPKPSRTYLRSHWTVITDEGQPVTGALELLKSAEICRSAS